MEEAKGDESFLGIDFTTVRPATIQLFNVRINVAGSLVEGEVENLTLMVTDTSGPIAAVTIGPISAKVTGTVAEGVLVTAGALVAVNVGVPVAVGVAVGMATAVEVSPAEKVATASV